jgi:hypothetical protein
VHRASRSEPSDNRERFSVTDGSQFNFLGTVPRRAKRRREGSIGNPARVEGDQVVRARHAQREFSIIVDRTAKAGARTLRITRWLGHRELVFNSRDPSQMFSDER